MMIDAVREGSRARRSWERGGFKELRGADGGGRGLRGWRGRHQTQQEWAAAAAQLASFAMPPSHCIIAFWGNKGESGERRQRHDWHAAPSTANDASGRRHRRAQPGGRGVMFE
jgi:hypothetical protein